MPGKAWPDWNWLEAFLLPLAGALMASAWIAPWLDGMLRALTRDPGVGGAGPAAVFLLTGGATLARLARQSQHGRWWVALGGLLGVVLAEWGLLYRGLYFLGDLRWLAALAAHIGGLSAAPLIVAVAAALLWRWGLTANWASHNELAQGFVVGVIGLGLSLVLAAAGLAWLPADLSGAIALFVFSAWSALALAGVQAATRTEAEAASVLRLNRYWLMVVLAVMGALFGVGLAVASLVSPQGLAALMAALEPVGQLLGAVLLIMFVGLAYVAFFFLTPLIWLLRWLAARGQPQPIEPPQPLSDLLKDLPAEAAVANPAVQWALRGLAIAALLIGLVLLFAWALRRYASVDEEGVQESRELIWSWDLLRAQLAGLLARRRRNVPPPLFGRLAGVPDDPCVAVRAAYRQVLALAVERGEPRQPGQTPQGYLPTLLRLWPEEAAALEALTRVYAGARYGRVLPSDEQLADLRRGLARITTQERPHANQNSARHRA